VTSGVLEWPLYAPALNPCDRFLLGYSKNYVYPTRSQTISELKRTITDVVEAISSDTLQNVFGNFERRLRHLVANADKPFEYLIN